jgi:hypothetical protein
MGAARGAPDSERASDSEGASDSKGAPDSRGCHRKRAAAEKGLLAPQFVGRKAREYRSYACEVCHGHVLVGLVGDLEATRPIRETRGVSTGTRHHGRVRVAGEDIRCRPHAPGLLARTRKGRKQRRRRVKLDGRPVSGATHIRVGAGYCRLRCGAGVVQLMLIC